MHQFGICDLTVIPVRASTDDRSEMVTQLLFGETFEITDSYKQWKKIRTGFDEYEGWIDEKQMQPLSHTAFTLHATYNVSVEKFSQAKSGFRAIELVIGSNLPGLSEGKFKINEELFEYEGESVAFNANYPPSTVTIIDYALKFMDTPYLWGGRSPLGIDCSGLTQIVFKLAGKVLKRDAHQQAEQGTLINLVAEAKPGDLAFFENDDKKIIHVGILLPEGKIIHASGKVRIDDLDHYGIFNREKKKYTHKLRLIKRIL